MGDEGHSFRFAQGHFARIGKNGAAVWIGIRSPVARPAGPWTRRDGPKALSAFDHNEGNEQSEKNANAAGRQEFA